MTLKTDLPEGCAALTPYFTVIGAARLIDFLIEAFDAELIMDKREDDNSVKHARLLIGGSVIMMNEASPGNLPNKTQMHFFVPDFEQTYNAALRAGATSIMEPNTRPHGDRMAGIEDPCGNTWWIATYRGQ